MKSYRFNSGFTMIEILTALAVLGVGLVSVASLTLVNLRSTVHGHSQSQATIIALELADTMRANLAAYESSLFAINLESGEKVCSGGTRCNFDEQAHYDGGQWEQHVADALPGATAILCMDSTPNDGTPTEPACDGAGLNTIKIFWTDTRNQDSLAQEDTFYRHALALVP